MAATAHQILEAIERALELCSKCGQPMQEGELVTGTTWNGDGGHHVNCPKQSH